MAAIRAKYPNLDLITRADGARFLSRALATMRRIGRIWLAAMVVLAGAIVLFAMLLAADERVRELGTLKAVGASTGDLAVVLVGESVFLAGIGAALGGLLYAVFGHALGAAFFKATFGVYLPGQYGDSLLDNMLVSYALSPVLVAALIVAAGSAGVLGSLYALYRAHRLSPVDALRA